MDSNPRPQSDLCAAGQVRQLGHVDHGVPQVGLSDAFRGANRVEVQDGVPVGDYVSPTCGECGYRVADPSPTPGLLCVIRTTSDPATPQNSVYPMYFNEG